MHGVGCNAEQATFNNCAKNALFDYVSQTYYKSIADFCAPKKAKQIDLYTCICSTAQTIVQCYTVTCPVDGTNMNAFETYMTDNCLYLQTLQQTVQPTSAVVAIPARTGSGFTSGGPVLAIPSGAPSSGSLTGASGSSGASKNSGAKSAISASALTLGVAALFVF
ncbi:hypothetical protein BC830DRAFT_1092414 [Chytriomyces sp. MP71]|nr:hypothetical protein BC830DRAFT_1092414 [Chytriomyces sp. MP71]